MPPFPKLETWLMHTHVNDNNLMAHNIKEIHTLCFGDCTFKHTSLRKCVEIALFVDDGLVTPFLNFVILLLYKEKPMLHWFY